jgi:hypothetical protein
MTTPTWEVALSRQVPGEKAGVLPGGQDTRFSRDAIRIRLRGGCPVGAGPRQRDAEEAEDSLLRA